MSHSWIFNACRPLLAVPESVGASSAPRSLPDEIRQIFDKPMYRNAVWGLHVVDLDTGEVIYDLNSERPMLIASVRKLFSVGLALDTLTPAHVFRTTVHAQGFTNLAGVLTGNLILVAEGDLAMGGRTNLDGSFAVAEFDHNEANALGNGQLTAPDPLAGFNNLAAQVAASGITQIVGDVIVDDRLFKPFDYRGEFEVGPMFVNDDVVDAALTLRDGSISVDWRPKSSAFAVQADLRVGPAGGDLELDLAIEPPLGDTSGALVGTVRGTLPKDFTPTLTNEFPLVRTFRVAHPSSFARTILIEALARVGVSVSAPTVAPNPAASLPKRDSYLNETCVATLVSHPFKDYAKYVLKVSYNIGADMSLMLFGLAHGKSTLVEAQAAELAVLKATFGISPDQIKFVDGSGGGDTMATGVAVTKLLRAMSQRPVFAEYLDSQPRLGIDGTLSFVKAFEADLTLAGAKGKVHAKTGTFVAGSGKGAVLEAQALAGYLDAKSGRRFAFALMVNHVGVISNVADVLPVFQDEGTISAILWKSL